MESISEDLTASVIFQKFLADAATYFCKRWINRELLAGAPEEQRGHSFFQHVTPDQRDSQAILENIQHLRYLMSGRWSLEAPISESAFALHQLVLQRSDDVLAAWNTVCVAFFTHPDFLHLLGDPMRRRHFLTGLSAGLGALSLPSLARLALASETTVADPHRYFVFAVFNGAWDPMLALDPRDPSVFTELSALKPAFRRAMTCSMVPQIRESLLLK